jgi:hypothetical protein
MTKLLFDKMTDLQTKWLFNALFIEPNDPIQYLMPIDEIIKLNISNFSNCLSQSNPHKKCTNLFLS